MSTSVVGLGEQRSPYVAGYFATHGPDLDQLGVGGVLGLLGAEQAWPEVGLIETEDLGDPSSSGRMRQAVLGDPSLNALRVDLYPFG